MRGLLGVPMRDRRGRTNGLILVTDKERGDFTDEDVSLLQQLATVASLALQHVEARISLEGADRHKNEFLAMLSHELRNPLAPIRNSLHILDRVAPGGDQARRAQAVIDRQIGHMTRLVDELLDVTRISRGKIQLQRERLDLGEMVRRAIDDHHPTFVRNGLAVEVAIPDESIWIDGDRTRIAQVMDNLLQNAAKFTPEAGKVTVSVEANKRLGQAVARVRDTGVGITPDMLPRLFEPFTQADTTLARTKGGLGLGLALVKGLVEMHGGAVSVESEGVGRGASFTVRVPLKDEEARADVPPRTVRERGPARRVLVIEDNADGAETLRDVLELGGHAVDVAYSGPGGIEKATAFGPEIVLCDIGLPGMDGYEVAQRMRADPALASVRLVALTGYAGPDDVLRARDAGFDDHLAKPPSAEDLERVLLRGGRRGP
jgi:signal transduction histidine kinase/ActR/RegA family two-component response regulator